MLGRGTRRIIRTRLSVACSASCTHQANRRDQKEGFLRMPEHSMLMFTLAVALAYVYAFVGGFTDAANAIATSVGSRVLSPRAAVAIAGTFNLLGGLTGT